MTDHPWLTPPTEQEDTTRVSFMITRVQKQRLRQLGYDEAQIAAMTPRQAHLILHSRS